jgi:hypothetical protein
MSRPADRFVATFEERAAETGVPLDRSRRDALATDDRWPLALATGDRQPLVPATGDRQPLVLASSDP